MCERKREICYGRPRDHELQARLSRILNLPIMLVFLRLIFFLFAWDSTVVLSPLLQPFNLKL